MKLLLDENISARLARGLEDVYPGSAQVRSVGLGSASDEEVWNFAADKGFMLVSKDSDFRQMSFLRGHPPKVIWVRLLLR